MHFGGPRFAGFMPDEKFVMFATFWR